MKSPTTLQKVTNDPVALMQGVRAAMTRANPSLEDRLPEVTVDNLRDFGSAIMSYQPAQNEFVDTLVNLIGKIWITYRLFTNPLRILKKGILEYGDTVEMVYVNVAKAHQFDPAIAETEWMKRELPDAETAFAKLNYRVFYKTTISDDMLRNAFMSWQGVSDFISGVFNAMYTGAEYDEFAVMKQQLAAYGENGGFAVQVIPDVTDDTTAHAALAAMKAASNKMAFMSGAYNSLGVLTATPKEKQVLLIDADTDAYLSVLGYATLFNLEPARTQYRIIVVDEIPLENVHAILVDEDFYAVWDALQKFTRDMNGQGLYWNYWAHYWRAFAVCPWANAIAFTSVKPTVTAVTVSPATATVAPGEKVKFRAQATGTGNPPAAATWTVTGAADSSTQVSPSGTLYVGAKETATSLTVTATNIYDNSKSGTATVTVTA